MKLLSELNQIYNLSDSQKTVLAMAKFSATPKQAYIATTGSEKLVYARDSLTKIGFISISNGEMFLTTTGNNAVTQYNLADENDQPTDDAVNLLQSAHADLNINGQEESDF